MNRKLTITYEIPEDICIILEQKAAAEGRRLEEVVAEHVARGRTRRHDLPAAEAARCAAAFERHFGTWDSGEEQCSENERIDADLIQEYGRCQERGD